MGEGPLEVDQGAEEDADAEDVAEETEGANDGHHHTLGGINQLTDDLGDMKYLLNNSKNNT